MIRHAGRAAALFAIGALFAGGAWAQDVTLVQSVDGAYPVAEELVGGDGATILLSSGGGMNHAERPVVRLTVGNRNIAKDNTAEITFTLTGATFAQDVGSGDLDLRDASDAIQSGFVSEVVAGGAIGDSEVTFMVEAAGTSSSGNIGIGEDNQISFWVPNLMVMPANLGSMSPAAGADPVPVMGAGIVAKLVQRRAVNAANASGVIVGVPFPMVTGASDMEGNANVEARQVVRLLNVVDIEMADTGGMATVALDARTVLATGVTVPVGEGEANALRVGTLTISVDAANGAYTLDPTKLAVDGTDGLDASLHGMVNVMVKGTFGTDGMVVYGPLGTGPYMAAEMIAASVAEANVDIPTSNPESGNFTTSMTDFLYVPGGADALRPGKITALATDAFDPGMMVMSEGVISYAGLAVQAYAHGVVRGYGVESSHLRVRCADGTDCVVFLDCFDQEGNHYGFQEAGVVPAGGLEVWSSDQVYDVLNPGWTKGRGACDLVSNGKLEVQHMVLSNHTLINNSDVVGREQADGDTEAFADIKEALADVCASVFGHPERAAATDIAAFDASPCGNAFSRMQMDGVGHGFDQTLLENIDTTPGDDSTR